MKNSNILVMGAVAYDPKVVTIWEGFKAYFYQNGLNFDYVLYSNYERQVEEHLAGRFDVAWNSPLAWIRAERLAASMGQKVEAVVMRDTDCDLSSLIIIKANSGIADINDLKGKTVAVGAIDSPQASLIPLSYLRSHGLTPGVDFEVQYHDLLGGKHGDHIGGEREAARALAAGGADAACMIDGNHLLFLSEGTFKPQTTRVLAQTELFDHCNFTVTESTPQHLVERFRELLLGMSYDDAAVRSLLDLEGLKAWREGRTEGYRALENAVDEFGFYDNDGNITASNYRY
jgi:ABC-type phosphate/phosphonate transport system substrate-binding protein